MGTNNPDSALLSAVLAAATAVFFLFRRLGLILFCLYLLSSSGSATRRRPAVPWHKALLERIRHNTPPLAPPDEESSPSLSPSAAPLPLPLPSSSSSSSSKSRTRAAPPSSPPPPPPPYSLPLATTPLGTLPLAAMKRREVDRARRRGRPSAGYAPRIAGPPPPPGARGGKKSATARSRSRDEAVHVVPLHHLVPVDLHEPNHGSGLIRRRSPGGGCTPGLGGCAAVLVEEEAGVRGIGRREDSGAMGGGRRHCRYSCR